MAKLLLCFDPWEVVFSINLVIVLYPPYTGIKYALERWQVWKIMQILLKKAIKLMPDYFATTLQESNYCCIGFLQSRIYNFFTTPSYSFLTPVSTALNLSSMQKNMNRLAIKNYKCEHSMRDVPILMCRVYRDDIMNQFQTNSCTVLGDCNFDLYSGGYLHFLTRL